MLEQLSPQPADKILALTAAFRADPRENKIDLGVGVYRNAQGLTPIKRAVKAAERRILDTQDTKVYTELTGDPAFRRELTGLILGAELAQELEPQLASSASVGGTGAVRLALELARAANPQLTVHYSDPTWPNHITILEALEIPHRSYRYFDAASSEVDLTGMLEDLAQVKAGDVVLLHGCCHNPTGANPTPQQWQQIAGVLAQTGALPLVDLAYQGFGDGLEADAFATRLLARELPEVLIAASCSKNFAIYRERTGLLIAKSRAEGRATVQANMAALNRQNFSFPPDHGARVVSTILEDAELCADWQSELEDVRLSMLELREQLAAELRERTGSDRFDFIARHRGMFSRLGVTPQQVDQLREEYGIYMTADSRVNIAGLNSQTVPLLADAVAEVIAES
ncbi:aromatic amino acid transaminase [Deinococcus sp. Marseille-Q6407]|uniref:amino acid aminotransferase n=1 Tax=Deinococcus sp. Marseille-Q6407 TaxID=2969223 RepID=UPI0021C00A2A|nr:amino acid aminotransferase [Deinococcus sp. Marseille-Q6407]